MVLPDLERPVRIEILGVDGLADVVPLLQLEHREIEAVLGQPVEFTAAGKSTSRQGLDHLWQVHLDPEAPAPRLAADLQRRRLISTVSRAEDFGLSLQLLHTLAHSSDSEVTYQEADNYAAVAERIREEVAATYPSFALRGLDWEAVCSRYAHMASLTGERFWREAQRWVAELGDAHTAVVEPGVRHHPPYIGQMTPEGARLLHVPLSSAAYRAGVRAGWMVHVQHPGLWLETVGASPQHHDAVAARRFMEMTTPERTFTAHSGSGAHATWTERTAPPGPSVITEGPAIRITRFDRETPRLFRQALRDSIRESEVTIDLRGNTGGSLLAADECRRMLLRESGTYGSARHSDGRGGLSAASPLQLESADLGFRGKSRLLVDLMTYSAAEDFLQPLIGLDDVAVEGGPTGGGSGRPRTIPLKDGYTLRVSTAITYTSAGTPIEYRGIRGTTTVSTRGLAQVTR